MNILLFHGFKGHAKNIFFPWITKELQELGHKVVAPQFPTPALPLKNNWVVEARRSLPKSQKELIETIIIGHSLGGVAALRTLEILKESEKIKGLILIGTPIDSRDRPIETFFEEPFNFPLIRQKAEKIISISSDNDPYVPVFHGEFLAKELRGEFILEKNHQHFQIPRYENLLKIMQYFLQ